MGKRKVEKKNQINPPSQKRVPSVLEAKPHETCTFSFRSECQGTICCSSGVVDATSIRIASALAAVPLELQMQLQSELHLLLGGHPEPPLRSYQPKFLRRKIANIHGQLFGKGNGTSRPIGSFRASFLGGGGKRICLASSDRKELRVPTFPWEKCLVLPCAAMGGF